MNCVNCWRTFRESSCWTALSTWSLEAFAVFSWRTVSPCATMLENKSPAEIEAGAGTEVEAALAEATGWDERQDSFRIYPEFKEIPWVPITFAEIFSLLWELADFQAMSFVWSLHYRLDQLAQKHSLCCWIGSCSSPWTQQSASPWRVHQERTAGHRDSPYSCLDC